MPNVRVFGLDKLYRNLYVAQDHAPEPDYSMEGDNGDWQKIFVLTPMQELALEKIGAGEFIIDVADDGSVAIKVRG